MQTITQTAGSGQQQSAAAKAALEARQAEHFYRFELYNPWTYGQPMRRKGAETAQDTPRWDKEI